jgi:DNA polymerase (family 10)
MMDNRTIADMFDEIADMLSLESFPNVQFEVRAYRKAALIIRSMQEPIYDIYGKGGLEALMEIPGVGKSIAASIEECIKTGKMRKYEMLRKKYPFSMRELTSIAGLGPKTALLLYRKLKIRNIADLKKAIAENRIGNVEGIREKSIEQLRKGIDLMEASKGRMIISDALPVAEQIIKRLTGSGLVERALVAGSARRMRETVGDLDILAISPNGEQVMEFFSRMPEVESTIMKGPTKTTVHLKIGLNCDIRVLEPKSFGAAVQYFTGSKDHNVQVRTIAIGKGYKLNEYGLFDKKGRNVVHEHEEGIYEKLGMQWMPPEMREARGEVKLAQQHKIPKLVELGNIRGDLHTHSVATDGQSTIEEMAASAAKMGYEYIANTDHTKSTRVANGMNDRQFAAHLDKIDRLNDKLAGKIRILKGVECDILKDGTLDLSSSMLKKMDCVVAAVHSNMAMERDEMTKRVAKALETGLVHILAHPTGRIVGVREPYKIDLEKVAESAERNNVAFEVNGQQRLDLNDTNIMLVSKYKVGFAINTDAHNTTHFALMRYGVGTARRGWLTENRVINTLPLERLLKTLKK